MVAGAIFGRQANVPVKTHLASLHLVAVVLVECVFCIGTLFKLDECKASIATSVAVDGDGDLTEAAESFKKINDVTLFKVVGQVAYKDAACASTLLL